MPETATGSRPHPTALPKRAIEIPNDFLMSLMSSANRYIETKHETVSTPPEESILAAKTNETGWRMNREAVDQDGSASVTGGAQVNEDGLQLVYRSSGLWAEMLGVPIENPQVFLKLNCEILFLRFIRRYSRQRATASATCNVSIKQGFLSGRRICYISKTYVQFNLYLISLFTVLDGHTHANGRDFPQRYARQSCIRDMSTVCEC